MNKTTKTNKENKEKLAVWQEALDPTIRETTMRYLKRLVETSPHDTSLSPTERLLCRELKPPIADNSFPWLMVPFFVVCLAIVFHISIEIAAIFIAAAIVAFLLQWKQKAQNQGGRTAALTTFLPRGLPLAAQTRTEKLYADAALQLLPSENDSLSDDTRREQMAHLNTLFTNGSRLEAIDAEIRSGLVGQEPGRLKAESTSLQERIARATDTETKALLEQSLALCEERRQRTERLQVLQERVEAQREIVYQAFGAAQSSLTSMRLSPSLVISASSGQTTEIVTSIGRQTAAVEQAVQEVLSLGAGR